MKKKLLAIVMSIMMLVVFIPTIAFGDTANKAAAIGDTQYDTLQDAINAAAANGDTVTLLKDVNEAVTVSGKDITLDLNDYDIASAGQSVATISVINGDGGTNKGKLTIKGDGIVENTFATGASLAGAIMAEGDGASVIINGGTYKCTPGNGSVVWAKEKATITVNGGNFIGGAASGSYKEGKAFYSGVGDSTNTQSEFPGKIIVNGGTFQGRMSNSNWGQYEIKGGTFDRNEVAEYTNGTWSDHNTVPTGSSTSTGNMITMEAAGWIPNGYKAVASSVSTKVMPYAEFDAQIESTTATADPVKYGTLQAAIDAAKDGDTVTLLEDVDEEIQVVGKDITLDLNGNDITSYQKLVATIEVTNGKTSAGATTYGKLTIKGDGTVENTYLVAGDLSSRGAILAEGDGASVIINGGTYKCAPGNAAAVWAKGNATITINDGKFIGGEATTVVKKEGKAFYSGVGDAQNTGEEFPGKIIVNGGTFQGRLSTSNWGQYEVNGGYFDRDSVESYTNPAWTDKTKAPTGKSQSDNKQITMKEAGWISSEYQVIQTGGMYRVVSTTECKVTFNVNGRGETPAVQSVYKGCTATEPTVKATGYKITGWYDNASLTGTAFDFSTPITADITLYAKWEPIKYKVQFNKNSSDATGTMADQEMTYDQEAALSANGFAKAGSTFKGWSLKSYGSATYANAEYVKNLAEKDGDTVKLYAQWGDLVQIDTSTGTATVDESNQTVTNPTNGTAETTVTSEDGSEILDAVT